MSEDVGRVSGVETLSKCFAEVGGRPRRRLGQAGSGAQRRVTLA